MIAPLLVPALLKARAGSLDAAVAGELPFRRAPHLGRCPLEQPAGSELVNTFPLRAGALSFSRIGSVWFPFPSHWRRKRARSCQKLCSRLGDAYDGLTRQSGWGRTQTSEYFVNSTNSAKPIIRQLRIMALWLFLNGFTVT
jgi:hypothetical protein